MITGSFQFALFDLVDACTHKMNQSGYKKKKKHLVSTLLASSTPEEPLIVAFVNRPLTLRNYHWSCYIFLPSLSADECGIVAQVSAPLAKAEISTYYICTFYTDHTLVSECALSRLWHHLFSLPLSTTFIIAACHIIIIVLHYLGNWQDISHCTSRMWWLLKVTQGYACNVSFQLQFSNLICMKCVCSLVVV